MSDEEKPLPLFVSLPIDVEHPEEFLGHEFLLAIDARVEANATRVQRARWVTQNLVNRLRRKEGVHVPDYGGYMMEVAERKPLMVRGYHWPQFNQVTLKDGTRVGSKFPADEAFRRYAFGRYIFVPEQAQVTQGTGYRLEGTMRQFDLYYNSVEELGHRVAVQFKNLPQSKTSGVDIGCLLV